MRRRRLPHLEVPDQPLFITFRLAGTLPRHRLFPAADLTSGEAFAAMERLLGEARYGPRFLHHPAIARMVLDSIDRGTALGQYDLHSWVIMPNHVHLLVTPHLPMARFLGPLKTATARRANLLLRTTGRGFWQKESYDHLVRTDEECRRIARYIENNPVTAGLAAKPENYPWSSACRRF